MKLDSFLGDLGQNKNGLGGGAAAALTGATGAALLEMVARLNDKRLKKSLGTPAKALSLRKEFQRQIAKDAKAFKDIQSAYKFREQKPALWQKTLKNGAKPPLETALLAYKGWSLIKAERARTSKWLLGDLMESFLLMDVVYGSAILNVDANLKFIEDISFNETVSKKLKKSEVHRGLWP